MNDACRSRISVTCWRWLRTLMWNVVKGLARNPFVRALISVAFLTILAVQVNIREALHAFTHIRWYWIGLAFPAYLLGRTAHAIRWHVILRPMGRLPVPSLLGILLVSNVANNFLPVRLGDVARVQITANRYGLSRTGVTSNVFVTETLLDGVAFITIALAAVIFASAGPIPEGLVVALAVGLAISLALAALLARTHLRPGWEDRPWLRLLPQPARLFLASHLPKFIEGLRIMGDWRLGGVATLLTFAAWLVEAAMFWAFGQAFGLGLEVPAYLILMVTANWVVSVPIGPSNIGPYEVVMAQVAIAFGAQSAVATAFAVGSHLMILIWLLAAGSLSMYLLKISREEVFSLRRRRPQEEPPEEYKRAA